MQIILHYSCSKCPCRFKHFWGHLDSSNYLGPHCSVMNKVFCTSKVCTRWAFKVALHWACVLLLVHEWVEHELQSVSGGKPWLGIHGWRDETRVSPSTHALPLSFKSLLLDSSSCLRMKESKRFILGKGVRGKNSSLLNFPIHRLFEQCPPFDYLLSVRKGCKVQSLWFFSMALDICLPICQPRLLS